jgi:hypothetical protein
MNTPEAMNTNGSTPNSPNSNHFLIKPKSANYAIDSPELEIINNVFQTGNVSLNYKHNVIKLILNVRTPLIRCLTLKI